jgi:hypothetical protein
MMQVLMCNMQGVGMHLMVGALCCKWILPPMNSPLPHQPKRHYQHLCCAVPLRCLQDRIHEHAQEFLDLMASDDCIFYFCGLKRMYTSVLDMLEVSRVSVGCLLKPLDICAQVQHMRQ